MQNNEALEKLRRELQDVSDLLDGALTKAKNLENKVTSFNFSGNTTSIVSDNIPTSNNSAEDSITNRPSNWDSIKESAINESIKKIDEGLAQKEEDTRKARTINSKNTKPEDWEDSPF